MQIKNESVWKNEIGGKYPELSKDVCADAVVIGAGMAGILTAYKLSQRGLDVAVIDAQNAGGGVTKNTTAKITSQHGLTYHKLLSAYGLERAKMYAQANESAINEYEKIARELDVDCDFERAQAFVYSNTDKELIRREMNAAVMCGIDAFYTESSSLPFKIKAAYGFRNQAQFDPMKFLNGVARRLKIYEHTKAVDIDIKNGAVITERGKITAKHIVVCTHYPFYNKKGYYFVRLFQQRSYVVAVKTGYQLGGMYISADDSGFSFRRAGEYVLLGGCQHRTGDTKQNCYGRLIHAAKLYFPKAPVTNRWAAQDCVAPDNIPYIGRYSSAVPRLYVATGFNKWGMTSSMAAAGIITDLILTNKSKYEKLFTPQRYNIAASQKNTAENIKFISSGMVGKFFKIPKNNVDDLRPDSGNVIYFEGKKLGVYKNKSGKLHAVSPVCPHLGCELKFNNEDKSWDCPCHGSRFDINGKCINNPANRGLEVFSAEK